MSQFSVGPAARERIDEIYDYTRRMWGEDQAELYVRGLFERFADIANQGVVWRAVPAEFGVDGYVTRYRHHFIYWKRLAGDAIGIVTILHERMHQIECFADDWGSNGGTNSKE